MGQYDYKDLQKDKDGNLYEQGKDGEWSKKKPKPKSWVTA